MIRPSGVSDVAWYDIERAIKARDAKHRAELERLKGELAEAKRVLEPYRAYDKRWAGGKIDAFLAAPSPRGSTPVLCEQHGREDCSRPDHAAPPDDIRERLRIVEDYLGLNSTLPTAECGHDIASISSYAHGLGQESARADVDAELKDHERRLAALEAKGEPGTHAFVDCPNCGDGCSLAGRCHRSRGNFSTSYGACGEARESAVHAKGAKP